MKKVIILVLLIIMVIAIPPFFIGSTVESQFKEQVANANSNPTYEITLIDYQKGWFSSEGEVEVTLKPTSSQASPIRIRGTQKLRHGPVLWQGKELAFGLVDAVFKFELPEDLQTELNKAAESSGQILSITGRTDFNLSSSAHLVLQAFTINNNGSKIDVQPANGHFSYDMNGHIEGALNWGGMTIMDAFSKTVIIGKVTMDTKQQLVSGEMLDPTSLFNGYFTANLSNLDITNKNENTSLQDLSIKATSEIGQKVAKLTLVLNIKQLATIQQIFKGLVYDMSFDRLEIEALKKMRQVIADTQGGNKIGTGQIGNSQMMLVAKMQGLLPALLAETPVIKVNKMAMETQAGEIISNLTLTVDEKLYDKNNPMTMMVAIKADAQGQAPEAFLASLGLSGKIEQMLQQNILVREQDNVKFEFTFKEGQALLNGQPMPLGGM